MIKVRVPATSANMGPGFDSLGIALSLYNTVTAEEIENGIVIENKQSREYIPSGENNLIYRAMVKVFEKTGYKPTGIKIVQDSEIPMTRGLGSSSACIIAGMLSANVMSGRKLTYQEILNLASAMEGHPDNVTPALLGGFSVAVKNGESVVSKSVKITSPVNFHIMVPDFFISTKKSRVSLPDTVSHKDAVYNAGNSALFALSLASGDFKNLKTAVGDRLHQPYRSEYIEGMEEIFAESYKNGAYAVWLSGSGPTIVAVTGRENQNFSYKMNDYFRLIGQKRTSKALTIDNVGAIIQEI